MIYTAIICKNFGTEPIRRYAEGKTREDFLNEMTRLVDQKQCRKNDNDSFLEFEDIKSLDFMERLGYYEQVMLEKKDFLVCFLNGEFKQYVVLEKDQE